jgi:hypothetical protein
MKRITSLLTATAALGLAAFAQTVAAQTSPSAQQSMPSQEPTTSTTRAPLAEPSAEPSPRLAAIVPSGMSAEEACTGFKSVRECATALHAAQNCNIPFADLKSKLTGGQKLGAAIHDLKPEANAKEEARKAEAQARSDTQGAPQG